MKTRDHPLDSTIGLVATIPIALTALLAASLSSRHPDLYYRLVQEDEIVEWATFWAFVLAACLCLVASKTFWQTSRRVPWFFLGLAFFCAAVAMEEISWGQRLLGYRPPPYFLENNFQQELNLHNVVGTRLRKFAMTALIAGYGLVLPAIALFPRASRWLRRRGWIVPPAETMPAFFVTFLTYQRYPWKYSGEWVELMLGTSLLSVAVLRQPAGSDPGDAADMGRALPPRSGRRLVVCWVLSWVLGLATVSLSRGLAEGHPHDLAAARLEIDALKRDLVGSDLSKRCGLHKRLYTYAQEYGDARFSAGEFSRLREKGIPAERSHYLLDPWNLPYWIHVVCRRDPRDHAVFVYSFGPNRRRDSSVQEIRVDDIGSRVKDRQ